MLGGVIDTAAAPAEILEYVYSGRWFDISRHSDLSVACVSSVPLMWLAELAVPS